MRSKAETLRVYMRILAPIMAWPNDTNAKIALMATLSSLYGDGYDAGHRAGIDAADTNFSFDELWSDDDEIPKD